MSHLRAKASAAAEVGRASERGAGAVEKARREESRAAADGGAARGFVADASPATGSCRTVAPADEEARRPRPRPKAEEDEDEPAALEDGGAEEEGGDAVGPASARPSNDK